MSIKPHNLFTCNSGGLNFTDAYHLVGPVPSDPILRIISCSVNIDVPILRAVADRLGSSRMSLDEALMQGFVVNYSVPNERLCAECSRLGGQCGFDSVLAQPVCICGDRPCPFAWAFAPEPSPDAEVPFEGICWWLISMFCDLRW